MDELYEVSWTCEVASESPEQAALDVAAMLQDPDNVASVFGVTDHSTGWVHIIDTEGGKAIPVRMDRAK